MSNPLGRKMYGVKEYPEGTIGYAVRQQTRLSTEEMAELFGVRVQLLERILRGDHPLTKTVLRGLVQVTKKGKRYWSQIDFNLWGI